MFDLAVAVKQVASDRGIGAAPEGDRIPVTRFHEAGILDQHFVPLGEQESRSTRGHGRGGAGDVGLLAAKVRTNLDLVKGQVVGRYQIAIDAIATTAPHVGALENHVFEREVGQVVGERAIIATLENIFTSRSDIELKCKIIDRPLGGKAITTILRTRVDAGDVGDGSQRGAGGSIHGPLDGQAIDAALAGEKAREGRRVGAAVANVGVLRGTGGVIKDVVCTRANQDDVIVNGSVDCVPEVGIRIAADCDGHGAFITTYRANLARLHHLRLKARRFCFPSATLPTRRSACLPASPGRLRARCKPFVVPLALRS